MAIVVVKIEYPDYFRLKEIVSWLDNNINENDWFVCFNHRRMSPKYFGDYWLKSWPPGDVGYYIFEFELLTTEAALLFKLTWQ